MARRATVLACIAWIFCGAYGARFVTRGWIPHDEGTIGQSAERVLNGEVPHRDFDDPYTGGLTYLHAAAMKAFGINLLTPRLMLFAFFLAFLAAVYAIARRVSSPAGALGAMALVTVWSLPNYFASLPSWYTVFLATFGVLALMRFTESGRRGWLVAAGVCGGFSLLAKITGAYYLVATLLFLLYGDGAHTGNRPPIAWPKFWLWLATLLPAGFMIWLLLQEPSVTAARAFAPLFFPALLTCGVIVWREWTAGASGAGDRARQLLDRLWPFVAGVAAVLVPFVILFWEADALPDLIAGTLVQPQRRLTEASISPPGLVTLLAATPYAALMLLGDRRARVSESAIAIALAAALGLALLFGNQPIVYRAIWSIVRALPLLAALAALALLARPAVEVGLSPSRRAHLFLLTAMASLLPLVQFPYASPTYFFYCAPMVVLALLSLVWAQPVAPLKLHTAIAAFFFAFAVVFANRSYGWNLGVRFIPYEPDAPLALDRGGLVVPIDDARTYRELVELLRARAEGGTIYAGPDCPEVYFLTGLSNPSRAFFDVLSVVREDREWMADLLARAPIRAVAINTQPMVSPPMDPDVQSLLELRFPHSRQVGRFIVRWQD